MNCNLLNRTRSIAVGATLLCGLLRAAERPNIVLVITDDHGYGDVSTYHASDVRTPNIDRLAAEGMLFTTMRANCTVCSPSRAALLTGRYPDRVGVPGVIRTHAENSWGYFDPRVPTLADELKQAWSSARWWPSPPTTAVPCPTPRTTIRGGTANRASASGVTFRRQSRPFPLQRGRASDLRPDSLRPVR